MKGHPGTRRAQAPPAEAPRPAEAEGLGAVLYLAVSDVDALRDRPDVDSLGTRVKRVTAKSGAERTYYLEGFAFRPAETPHVCGVRFYRLSGGAGTAVTALDARGEPVADANRPGRGFSPGFREWIGRVVAVDAERCGF